MPESYKTPNVYVEEVSTLPPTAVSAATALPAFIGYTQKAKKGGNDVSNKPVLVSTMLEYENVFGGAPSSSFAVNVVDADGTKVVSSVSLADQTFKLYHSVRMYFENGGGSCYIVSVGGYDASAVDQAQLVAGIASLAAEQNVTILAAPDAVNLASADQKLFADKALKHCKEMQNCFTILDVKMHNDGSTQDDKEFRENVIAGVENAKYGAAYYPYVTTVLNHSFDVTKVTVKDGAEDKLLATYKDGETNKLYNDIVAKLSGHKVVLPPSAIIAGVYARVDNERGVWKSPANVSLSSVIAPAKKISDNEQATLNADDLGKSINAIRNFVGKGTLVWGARTLDGNSNEWRYVSTRRLFSYAEDSLKSSTGFAIFEPNNGSTWLLVETIITKFLDGLWRNGALVGANAEQAYFVNIGLNKSMTEQDVLEGRMIIEVGMAAVRPAEFVILRFTHKLQEA